MSRKREAVFMGLGVLAGLALSGPVAQAATSITATLSNQPIYVNGQRISITAYSIGGNNYVKLRDIGRAVDFGVTYDATTNSVHIDSTQSYQDEVQSVATVTVESVRAALAQLRETYPTGDSVPHALPLQQRRALPPGHPLLWLGYAVFRRGVWKPPVAEGAQPKLESDPPR